MSHLTLLDWLLQFTISQSRSCCTSSPVFKDHETVQPTLSFVNPRMYIPHHYSLSFTGYLLKLEAPTTLLASVSLPLTSLLPFMFDILHLCFCFIICHWLICSGLSLVSWISASVSLLWTSASLLMFHCHYLLWPRLSNTPYLCFCLSVCLLQCGHPSRNPSTIEVHNERWSCLPLFWLTPRIRYALLCVSSLLA